MNNNYWEKCGDYIDIRYDKSGEGIAKITINQDIITKLLKDEILTKYYYKNGVYENHLKNDESIFEAVKLLNNQNKYEQILSAK